MKKAKSNKNLIDLDVKESKGKTPKHFTFVEKEIFNDNDDFMELTPETTQIDEFSKHIMAMMKRNEPLFLQELQQPRFTLCPQYRTILVNWLIIVHNDFHFQEQTLYNGVSLFDRFSAIANIPKSKIQLFGATSLWIASKLEETVTPAIEDFEYICGNAYRKQQILDCERIICKSLNFMLYSHTPQTFYEGIAKKANLDPDLQDYFTFFLNCAILLPQYSTLKPSLVASSCIL